MNFFLFRSIQLHSALILSILQRSQKRERFDFLENKNLCKTYDFGKSCRNKIGAGEIFSLYEHSINLKDAVKDGGIM